ncbi:MAG: hypothetical protein COV35_02425 [Alphaproteobacteria bacterium CG11_big_fil_rev_8_21_14_0_20_39_49]|nr:MAG: hypothetical protein COV35_02425 [Alphaproteobacteria bacterium CG11_big_fil_rev_8_21_14_0_20_39_49]
MHVCKSERPKSEKGFTLIELSIVIVIIGLIVAGVIGGQALVEQAKIRSQISEFQKYSVAYNTFKIEYNAILGDFNRASQYWTGAFDGDGNEAISVNADNMGASLPNESLSFFTHL